ncbi:PHD finger protein [Musa troglodytarum]|uniref:PHD finger protein ALFIN-LIKE n=1 Tax=Musa troglodytarum TaxID=320322 RepID=A0A9E7JEC4_9LILI|nr:PHD finger protein [Musa troglodytarum]
MDEDEVARVSRTPEEVFRDFRGRRAGMIKALTTGCASSPSLVRFPGFFIDVDKFYQQCDPEKENLCLYGFPNETWEVNLPAEEVPPELPEPALGINFARDGMAENDWLALVAVHSDAWLLAVAFYFGARFGFDKESRRRLHNMINNLPTIYEVVTGTAKQQPREKNPNGTSKSNKSSSKKVEYILLKSLLSFLFAVSASCLGASDHQSRQAEPQKSSKMPPSKEEDGSRVEEDEEEHENTLCGACGDNYANDEFWICCDMCEKWFHGKCVKITPARAEHIKQYKCPSCSNNKRARA